MMRGLITFVLLALFGVVSALSSAGNRLLVVLEEESEKSLYSQFWSDLESRGFKLSFESPKSDSLSLFELGERAYDHLILLPPKSKGFGPKLTPQALIEFVNAEGNILLTLSGASGTPSAVSSLLLELDIRISPDRTSVTVDHFNYDIASAAEKHDVLLLPRPTAPRSDLKSFFSGNGIVAFPRAVSQTLGYASPLLAPIVKAPETAYTYNTKEDSGSLEDLFASGTQLSLVSAAQARNSARFVVLGSTELLEDKWFDAQVKSPKASKAVKTVNREFAQQLTQWTFKEAGVLKAGVVDHYLNTDGPEKKDAALHLTGEDEPIIYRVKNDIAFTIELSEYTNDHWGPYIAPEDDAVQLEFTMLSPHYRIPLTPLEVKQNSTVFGTTFTIPDVYGVFTFRVNYKRPFLTNIDEKHTVTVRHYAHDEYPRSWTISGAWPWIAGLWSVIGGFVMFVGVWLYCETPKETGLKKTQ